MTTDNTADRVELPTLYPMPIEYERQQFFWSRTHKDGEHLIWEGANTTRDYGRMLIDGKAVYAHRVSYCIANNIDLKDIEGQRLIKTCPINECVAPAHLVLKTK